MNVGHGHLIDGNIIQTSKLLGGNITNKKIRNGSDGSRYFRIGGTYGSKNLGTGGRLEIVASFDLKVRRAGFARQVKGRMIVRVGFPLESSTGRAGQMLDKAFGGSPDQVGSVVPFVALLIAAFTPESVYRIHVKK